MDGNLYNLLYRLIPSIVLRFIKDSSEDVAAQEFEYAVSTEDKIP